MRCYLYPESMRLLLLVEVLSDLVEATFPKSTLERNIIEPHIILIQFKNIGKSRAFCTRKLHQASERIPFCPFHGYVVLVGRL